MKPVFKGPVLIEICSLFHVDEEFPKTNYPRIEWLDYQVVKAVSQVAKGPCFLVCCNVGPILNAHEGKKRVCILGFHFFMSDCCFVELW